MISGEHLWLKSNTINADLNYFGLENATGTIDFIKAIAKKVEDIFDSDGIIETAGIVLHKFVTIVPLPDLNKDNIILLLQVAHQLDAVAVGMVQQGEIDSVNLEGSGKFPLDPVGSLGRDSMTSPIGFPYNEAIQITAAWKNDSCKQMLMWIHREDDSVSLIRDENVIFDSDVL